MKDNNWSSLIRISPLRRLFGTGLLLLLSGWLHGASVLDFPRLAFGTDEITGVAIVNPNSEDAEATLTAYGRDGAVLAMRQIRIPAGRQIATLTRELFGGDFAPETVGWFQAFSMSPGLTGFFLILNAEGTEFDGADLPVRSPRIIFNQIRVGGGFSTELNLVNTGGNGTEVELTLVTGEGEPIVRDLTLAARGAARLDVAALFDQADLAPGAYVLAEGNEDLAGFELVKTAGGDVQGLNARSAGELLNAIYFPQMSVLGPFVTRLGLTNLSDRAVIATVTAHGPAGGLFVDEVRANPVALSLAPGQSLDRDLVELFGFRGDEGLEGWLEVRSTSTAITGYLELQIPGAGAAATLSPVPQGSSRALFSHLATSSGFFTGVALLNPGSLAADVRVVALSGSGQLLGTFDAVLQPGQRINRLVTDLIPQAGGQSGGLLLVRSNLPVFSSSLFGTVQGGVLSNIPAQPAPDSFRPDAGVPVPAVIPRFTILFGGNAQSFRTEQLPGDVRWLVNGVEGGSAESGAIDQAGRYVAPPVAPEALPVVITAVSGSQTAGGSVDVASLQELASGVGLVQSLAFLSGLERLYTAELGAVGAPAVHQAAVRPQQGLISTIFGMGEDGQRAAVVNLQGEEIPKMIPFVARDNREYLLAAGQIGGEVLRVDPTSGAVRVVARDLDAPGALVLDPVTGNLLVAEAQQVTSIPRRQLESDLTPAAVLPNPGESPLRTVVFAPISGVAGLAVDACTGIVYLSQRTGALVDFERDSGESKRILEGLGQPGQMAGFYRAGVSCPDSFQLLIVEEEADQVVLVVPSQGEVVSPWVPDVDLDDIAILPADSPFESKVVFGMNSTDGTGDAALLGIDLPGLYEDEPINPPRAEAPLRSTSAPGPDLAVGESRARAGATATVELFYRPGPVDGSEGGSDRTNALAFTLDYDASRLRFDPTDTNDDGLPDSVIPNTPAGFRVFVFFDPNAPDGELGIGVVDPTGGGSLPEDSLLSISFRVAQGGLGTAGLAFSRSLPPQGSNVLLGSVFRMDETADGSVSITP